MINVCWVSGQIKGIGGGRCGGHGYTWSGKTGSDPGNGLLFTSSRCEPSHVRESRKNKEWTYAVAGHSRDRRRPVLSRLPHILTREGMGAARGEKASKALNHCGYFYFRKHIHLLNSRGSKMQGDLKLWLTKQNMWCSESPRDKSMRKWFLHKASEYGVLIYFQDRLLCLKRFWNCSPEREHSSTRRLGEHRSRISVGVQ